MTIKHIQSDPISMLSVCSSLRGCRSNLQEPRSDKQTEYNGVTTVVLRLVLIRIDESCHKSSTIGNCELQRSCGRPLVVPRAVI